MADQQVPPNEETPAAAGPEGSGAAEQADVDWQKRYGDLQPEYTRSTQRVRELEDREKWYELALTSEDADTRRQAVEALGYMLEDEDSSPGEPAEYEDPYVALMDRQERLEQRLAERDQQDREARDSALIKAHTDERLAKLEGLDQEDQDWVLAYAINALPAVREPDIPVPLPDIARAYEVFTARETERQKRWASTKRAPHVSPGGQTATEVPNLDTHKARVDYAMARLRENESLE